MALENDAVAEVYSVTAKEPNAASQSYGLRHGILSPVETLAQSISAMAPSTSPTTTIPLVFALAGNGTWFVYLLATIATLLVGFCVSRFAKLSASPGSLYTYVAETLRPSLAAATAWALLLAYVGTGASVAGGAFYYANVLLQAFLGRTTSPTLLVAILIGLAAWIAYRDVKLSAQTMLWIELVSITLIAIVIVLLLWKRGLHVDPEQVKLRGLTPSGARLGLILALFSFVGFESASTLGCEAREPLKTIPRAVLQCAILAGGFFILCSYAEVLGFHGEGQQLNESTSPLHVLAGKAGVGFLGSAIDLGALISMFACILACITAAARVLLHMAHSGLAHRWFSKTHHQHATPGAAVLLSGLATLLPTAILAARGVSGFDIYGWLGSLATYGFLTAYALVAIALPFARRARGQHSALVVSLSGLTGIVMILALAGSIYPLPPAPYRWFPCIYVAYLLAGMAWYMIKRKSLVAIVQG